MKPIKITRLLTGTLFREGAGVKLHRYIGADKNNDWEPILLFDYFDSHEAIDFMAGFPAHPHRGFETITYLLQGSITHEDNHGHKGTIGAGDVQWMTAGKGVIHSEMPDPASNRLHGLQMWFNLPAAEKMREPRYQERQCKELPVERHENGVCIKVIAGKTDKGTLSPVIEIATQPLFLDIHMPEGTKVQQHIPVGYQSILFVVSGRVSVGGEKIIAGLLAGLTSGEVLSISALETSQCLLIAAAKLNESITRYGPFVMNTQEEVMQALDDFRNGLF